MADSIMRMYCDRRAISESQPGTPISFIAASQGIKRDGLDIVVRGGRFENYLKNPIVTWAHDTWGNNLPIGRADVNIEVGADGDVLKALITFDQEDEFAKQIESKYRRGYLNAISINWITIKRENDVITEWELIEIGCVPVPGDADALIQRQFWLRRLATAETEPSVEDVWMELAARMVSTFRPAPDESDETREKRYKALLPEYRRLGKTPPEFIPAAELAALGEREFGEIFLEGELDAIARAGAALNKRNREDIVTAVGLLQSILDRTTVTDEDTDEDRSHKPHANQHPPEAPNQARALAALESIKNRLGGQNA